jgi:hypothetical protein
MTEKRQTAQGYIIRILQHFATKLWNITNFAMLFQAVMKFLSRLVEIKILVIRGKVHWSINYTYITLGACHRHSDYMYVRNGKSRAFATIEKITETQLRFLLLELFKCKNLLLTDIWRQIVLLPANLQLQIEHRYCDFVFGTLNTYAMN